MDECPKNAAIFPDPTMVTRSGFSTGKGERVRKRRDDGRGKAHGRLSAWELRTTGEGWRKKETKKEKDKERENKERMKKRIKER